MKELVVDASVAFKWFSKEVHSAAASRLFDGEAVLCAPDLIGPELGNALWKKIRRAEITAADAIEIIGAFGRIGVEIYPTAVLLPSALKLAVNLDCTVYDCLYLALAVAKNCALVTADQRLYSAARATALATNIRWVDDEL
ncbi:MAG: type II toxin-antitoxin system VapC family toxin [Acidobacteriota bacterium]